MPAQRSERAPSSAHRPLRARETVGFLAVAVMMGVAAVGRALGLALDGFDKASLRSMVVEAITAGVLVLAHVQAGGA